MRVPVQAPPATPPTYGLLVSARPVTEPDERWVNGLTWDPESCGFTGTADPCFRAAKPLGDDRPEFVAYYPFIVWSYDTCTTMGQRGDVYRARATRLLLACESKAIEAELWSAGQARGTAPGHPENAYLASSAAEVLTTATGHPVDALGALEDGLADCSCGGIGMIHATPATVTAWVSFNLIDRAPTGLLTTKLGTIVVPGQGYDGSGPGDAPGDDPVDPGDGAAWAYATQRVDVRRGSIIVIGAEGTDVDRSTNTITVRAERPAAATFDPCCHLATLVNVAQGVA